MGVGSKPEAVLYQDVSNMKPAYLFPVFARLAGSKEGAKTVSLFNGQLSSVSFQRVY